MSDSIGPRREEPRPAAVPEPVPRVGPSTVARSWAASLLGVVWIAAQPAVAQTLTGSVVSTSGDPLAGVVVTLAPRIGDRMIGGVRRTVTTESGRFAFTAPTDGDYLLRAERLGFVPFTSDALALRSRDPVEVRLTLDVEPLLMEPLEVTASSRSWWEVLQPPGLWPFFDRMERYGLEGRGRFFTRRDVERWRGLPVGHALTGVLPYLRLEQAPGRPGQYVLRGPGRCEPVVFVNGSFVDLAPKGPNGRVIEHIPIDLVVDTHSLVAVESYRGMSQAPAELQSLRRGVDLNCTVLGLWTLRR